MGTNVGSSSKNGVRSALILLDGLGDRPHPETGGVSPVEAAATPNLDRLANIGTLGDVVVVGPGIAPESDAGVLAILGYDPVTDSPGRGVLEALGLGLPLAPGDVAFRLNFATLDGESRVLDARVGRSLSTDDATTLAKALNEADLGAAESVRAEVRPTVGHRGVLWLRPTDGVPLSSNVSNSDPFYERDGGLGKARRSEDPRVRTIEPLAPDPGAERTAIVANRVSASAPHLLAGVSVNAKRALSGKPVANGLLLRNAGAVPSAGHPPSFESKYGISAAAVTEMPVERGIARLLGLRDEFVGPMGADRERALRERAAATRSALETNEFVYVHLKGPDEPGHDGRAAAKREIVEQLDRWFFGPFLEGLDLSRVRVAVTADHATPCILKGHSDDPVPLVVAGAGVPSSASSPPPKFGERSAALGRLGHLRGRDVMPRLLDAAAA